MKEIQSNWKSSDILKLSKNAPIGIIISRNLKVLYLNEHALKILEYDEEDELLNQNILKVIPQELHNYIIKSAERIENEKLKEIEFEINILTKNQKEIPVELKTTTDIWTDGVVIVTFFDSIEKRKINEIKLIESEKRYRILFENVPQALTVINYDTGKFEFVNEMAEDIFKMDREELIELGPVDLSPKYQPNGKLSVELLVKYLTKALDNEKPHFEWVHINNFNDRIYVEIRIVHFPFDEKNLLLASITDINERKQQEIQIKESEARYRTLVEHSTDAIFIYDDDIKKFIDANSNAAKLLGRTRNEIYNMKPVELYDTDYRLSNQKAIDDRIKKVFDGEKVIQEVVIKNKFGEKIPCELRMIVFPSKDRRLIRASFIDISVRKANEHELNNIREQLYHSQKLDAIGRITGGIAHDFNNILTIIGGYSKLLLNEDKIEEYIKDYINKIYVASEQAAKLTQQLLSFSRKRILNLTVTNLNEIIVNAVKMISRVLFDNIYIETNLADNLGLVNIDVDQMEQILINLSINSRDALPNGGKITITTNNLIKADGKFILLSFMDNGIGMSEEDQKKIFEPFFSTKQTGQNSGLGLSTAHGIIKQFNGNITVDSQIGVGTIFNIQLPMVDESGFKKQVLDKSNRSNNNNRSNNKELMILHEKSILVIDDDKNLRELVVKILKKNNYIVYSASNATETIALVKNNSIDLLLTDIVMADVNGLELSYMVKEIDPEISILFMTGYSRMEIINEIKDLSYQIIEKPFTPKELLNRIHLIFINAI